MSSCVCVGFFFKKILRGIKFYKILIINYLKFSKGYKPLENCSLNKIYSHIYFKI